MHENDLFKIAVRNLTEEDIATNLGMPEAAVDKDSKQQALLTFFKVWCGYTKYLQSQVLLKARSVVCPVFGTFIPAASYIQS